MITTKQSHSAPVQRCHLSMSLIAAYMLCKMNSVGRGSERLATKRGYLSLVPSRPMICGFQRKRNEQQVHENVALGVRKLNLKWPDAVVGNPCRGGKTLGLALAKCPARKASHQAAPRKKRRSSSASACAKRPSVCWLWCPGLPQGSSKQRGTFALEPPCVLVHCMSCQTC
jgi:hypothetical protein